MPDVEGPSLLGPRPRVSLTAPVLPAGTPAAPTQKLVQALQAALKNPELGKRFAEINLDPGTSTPEELQKIYETDLLRWRKVMADANLQPQ